MSVSDTPRTDAIWLERLHAHPFLINEVEETRLIEKETIRLKQLLSESHSALNWSIEMLREKHETGKRSKKQEP